MHSTIPLDVPQQYQAQFIRNYKSLVQSNGSTLLYAVDHKIEHLHDDFKNLPQPSIDHCFEIAQQSKATTLATHVGMITRYSKKYPDVTYIAKLNGKSHIIPTQYKDPLSTSLWSVEQVAQLAATTKCNIAGIGYTIYIGSSHEAQMLEQAAHLIYQAHQHGLVAIIWCYPRGQHIKEVTPHVLAGAAGVATSLGADFVKLPLPKNQNGTLASFDDFATIYDAAGSTKVIYSGGSKLPTQSFLKQTKELQAYPFSGYAIGRNIYQLPFNQAVATSDALYDMLHFQRTTLTMNKLDVPNQIGA